MAYISNAQRINIYRQDINTPFLKRKAGEKPAGQLSFPLNAGGLGCSMGGDKQPQTIKMWAEKKLEQLNRRTESKTTSPALPESEKVKEM